VTLKTEQRIIAIHSYAVINDSDQRGATASNGDFNTGRTRIDAVLGEFLNNRCRSLDNFSRSDLARYLVRQQENSTHIRILEKQNRIIDESSLVSELFIFRAVLLFKDSHGIPGIV
jgi:hypothetical protein